MFGRNWLPVAGTALLLCWALSFPRQSLAQSAEILVNPGFEGIFAPIPVSTSQAIVTGVLPSGWIDFSGASDLSVSYTKSTNIVHSGKSSLNIVVEGYNKGEAEVGQNVDGLNKGQSYDFSAWVFASTRTHVDIGVRDPDSRDTVLADVAQTVSASWAQIKGRFVGPNSGKICFFINLTGDSDVVVDDASIHPTPMN